MSRPPLPSGRAYAELLDQKTNRLVLVPWSATVSAIEGRRVEVVVDQTKRATVRSPRRLDRGEE